MKRLHGRWRTFPPYMSKHAKEGHMMLSQGEGLRYDSSAKVEKSKNGAKYRFTYKDTRNETA